MQQFSIYEGVIQLRSSPKYQIREWREKHNWVKVKLEPLRSIEPEDSSIYSWEWAMRILEPNIEDIVRIASGDIKDLKKVDDFKS